MPPFSFDHAPFILFWETTQACDLVCQHCRASAVPEPSPQELSTEEGKALLDEARAMGCPIVVLTGGDPAKRSDLVELVRHGSALGLRMALTPSATPLVTPSLLGALTEAGLSRLAISLDGADAATHEAFRGVSGSYARTLEILSAARRLGLSTQVNTSIVQSNVDALEAIEGIVRGLEIDLWAIFLVVPTGRAEAEGCLDAERVEAVLEYLAALSERAPFDLKTTAAPQLRRMLLQRKVRRQEIAGIEDGIGRAPRGVTDGQGVAFVSHLGEIYPSGFMPISCGNVRREGLMKAYRDDALMRALRDPDALGGKCGLCEFRKVCGGSRARALAMTGDPLAADPACAYLPRRWVEQGAIP
ncbi:MAG: TIGR04053 family radical SAM/SPASM domain-containing protein [Myxococcales bacterium]|nr:TIGR04053 family radical SAM/SPASM domain-containing protein [Myxococcales bacterium]